MLKNFFKGIKSVAEELDVFKSYLIYLKKNHRTSRNEKHKP